VRASMAIMAGLGRNLASNIVGDREWQSGLNKMQLR
jgi:hypothetical protein